MDAAEIRDFANDVYAAIIKGNVAADHTWTGADATVAQGYWMIADVTDLDGNEANSLVMVDTKGQDALTITPKTTTGCFFGLAAISLDGSTLYTPINTGTRTSDDRKVKTLSLASSLGANSVTLTHQGNGQQYIDLTGTETMRVMADETVTAAVTLASGHWIHAYTYIDLAHDGFTADIAADGYTPTEDLMTYSCYSANTQNWYNSAGAVSNNNKLVMPTFKAPAEPGTYRIRFKTDWNDLQPDGSGSQFVSAWGTIIDLTLIVEENTTDIEVSTANSQQPTAIYDLQGRRVANPSKGIYIVDGEKVIF